MIYSYIRIQIWYSKYIPKIGGGVDVMLAAKRGKKFTINIEFRMIVVCANQIHALQVTPSLASSISMGQMQL